MMDCIGSTPRHCKYRNEVDQQQLASGPRRVLTWWTAGGLGGRVYAEFAGYMGPFKVALLAVCMVVGQGLFLAASYWLAIWASRTRAVQREAK
jgi:hypothetical protein